MERAMMTRMPLSLKGMPPPCWQHWTPCSSPHSESNLKRKNKLEKAAPEERCALEDKFRKEREAEVREAKEEAENSKEFRSLVEAYKADKVKRYEIRAMSKDGYIVQIMHTLHCLPGI